MVGFDLETPIFPNTIANVFVYVQNVCYLHSSFRHPNDKRSLPYVLIKLSFVWNIFLLFSKQTIKPNNNNRKIRKLIRKSWNCAREDSMHQIEGPEQKQTEIKKKIKIVCYRLRRHFFRIYSIVRVHKHSFYLFNSLTRKGSVHYHYLSSSGGHQESFISLYLLIIPY